MRIAILDDYQNVAPRIADWSGNAFLNQHNADPRPFRRIKSADDILAAVERFCVYNTSSI